MNQYKKVVVKIGSALITAGGKGLDRDMITDWAEQMAGLREQGVDVVLVSSGSIAEGISRLGLKSRPKNISELQATAAPKGDEGEDFTEADIFCEDNYCPNVDCEGKVVAEAMCSRNLAITGYHQCICDCCEQQLNVGGTADNPAVWEEVYTCLLDFGDPPCQQDTRVELELVQSGVCGQTVDWTISSEGPDEGNQYSGTLNNGSFNWTSVPATDTPEEEGCWQFSGDAQKFNKLSSGSGFDCVGIGTRGDGSDPGTTPTCDEIADAGVPDFTQCPPTPDASRID